MPTEPHWRSAHDLLGDDADRFGARWERLLSFEESQEDRQSRLRDMVEAGFTPREIALRLNMRPATARHAVAMMRRRLRGRTSRV